MEEFERYFGELMEFHVLLHMEKSRFMEKEKSRMTSKMKWIVEPFCKVGIIRVNELYGEMLCIWMS